MQLVEQGRTTEQAVNAKREADFLADKNKQAAKLAAEKRELARQEKIADQLEAEYKKNDAILVVKEAAYKKELGSLVELFGHLQSSAGEASALFADSLTSAQYGRERESFLNELSSKMSSATVLPTIRELEGLWYALQQEMTAQGEVKTFTGKIVGSDGIAGPAEITRVGPFTAISDNRFLRYAGDGKFVELGRQPMESFFAVETWLPPSKPE